MVKKSKKNKPQKPATVEASEVIEDEVVDDAVEAIGFEDVEGDEEIEEIVDTTYIADLRATSLVTRSAQSDAAVVAKLNKTQDPEVRKPLVIEHTKNLVNGSDNASLAIGEMLYEIRANGYWKGQKDASGNEYTKIDAYWEEKFGIKPATGFRCLKGYEKLVKELDLTADEISKISMSVWFSVADILTEDNYEEVRTAIEDMTVKDAAAFAKSVKSIGVEEAVAHKDDEKDDILPEGNALDDDSEDNGDDEDFSEDVKTIKMVVAASTYELFNATLDAAASKLDRVKGEPVDAKRARALYHVLLEWSTSFDDTSSADTSEELLAFYIESLEKRFNVQLGIADEEGFEDDDE